MRKMLLLVVIVSLSLLVVPAFSQEWETKATINAPVEFVVGGTVLPAGDYRIQTAITSPHRLILTNVKTGDSAVTSSLDIVLSPPGSVAPESKMVFALDGKRHVLHQIVVAGDTHVHDLVHGPDVVELVTPKR